MGNISKFSDRHAFEDEIKKLADEHLSSLNSNYRVSVDWAGYVTAVRVQPKVWPISFEWSDVKDVLVPFTKLLAESYELDENPINIQFKQKFTIEETENGLNPIVLVQIFILNK